MDPVFMSIILVAAAVPRRSGGTVFIMELVFGEENRPLPAPKAIMRAAICQYGVE